MIIFGKNQISHFNSEEKREIFTKTYMEALKNYPEPTGIYDLKTSFGVVRVYEYLPKHGQGATPMVLFHGHYASSLMWEPNLKAFIDIMPVYLLDFIDEPGLSQQSRAFKNHKEEALYLEEVFDKLKLLKFHLIGVSLGGWRAVNYTYYFPKRVASLVLLDPVSVFSYLSKKMISHYLISLVNNYDMVEYLLNGEKLPQGNPFVETINMARDDFYFGTAFPLGTREKALKALTCPVLAIMAGKSPLHDGDTAMRNGREWVSNIEIENWQDATHALTYMLAHEVNSKIKLFINRIEQTDQINHS